MKWTFSFVTLLFSLVLSALASEESIVYLDQSAPRRTRVTFGLRVETDLGPANVETIYTQQAGPVLLIIKAERDYAARLERDVLVKKVLRNEGLMQPVQRSPTEDSDIDGGNSSLVQREIATQSNPSQDLRLISWPPDRSLPRFINKQPFVYDDARKMDTYVYVLSEGVNTAHSDFSLDRVDDWILPRRGATDPTDRTGYGTCTASKALGVVNGVSKAARLVLVKVQMDAASISAALIKTTDQIESMKRAAVSVVILPFQSIQDFPSIDISVEDTEPWRTILGAIRSLTEIGVPVIVPAGDDGKQTWGVNALPQIWASLSDLIVVSAVTQRAGKASFTQVLPRSSRGTRRIYAPGEKVACAGLKESGTVEKTGTAFAAGMVAGLISYFQGLPEVPFQPDITDIEDHISLTSRELKGSEGPPFIWNQQDPFSIETTMVSRAAGNMSDVLFA